MGSLGRRIPTDWIHVERFGLRALLDDPGHGLVVPRKPAEVGLGLPWYWREWDQGNEGACVGFGTSAMMGITNTRQDWRNGIPNATWRYEPKWLYTNAQLVDEWADTPPAEGTSVRAACDVLRTQGHRRVIRGKVQPVDVSQGIAANRWATTVDEIRAAIFNQTAVSIGVNWYSGFDSQEIIDGETWTGRGPLGAIRGGHCVCLYRMSDRRQAFRFMNSWGDSYFPTWLPYETMQRLLGEYGEAAVITDR